MIKRFLFPADNTGMIRYSVVWLGLSMVIAALVISRRAYYISHYAGHQPEWVRYWRPRSRGRVIVDRLCLVALWVVPFAIFGHLLLRSAWHVVHHAVFR